MTALDRLARGKGALSDAQSAEWAKRWVIKEHKEAWARTFAAWTQSVANDVAAGNRAALSQFV